MADNDAKKVELVDKLVEMQAKQAEMRALIAIENASDEHVAVHAKGAEITALATAITALKKELALHD